MNASKHAVAAKGKFRSWILGGVIGAVVALAAAGIIVLSPAALSKFARGEAFCGNSVIEAGEECDSATFDKQDCTTIGRGYTGGTLRCSAACRFDTGGCTTTLTATVPPITAPTAAVCGNGVLNTGEQCDDGNSYPGDECDVDGETPYSYGGCTLTFCGDGFIQEENGEGDAEECDDGNTVSGDGCSGSCLLEVGTSLCGTAEQVCEFGTGRACTTADGYGGVRNCKSDCSGYRSCSSTRYCGDGIVSGPEGCDDGNANSYDACKNDCTFNVCGDGTVRAVVEECDDGNTRNGDGCSSGCRTEAAVPVCGAADGLCPAGCSHDASGDADCSHCGDGIIQRPNSDGETEKCDDGNSAGGDGCDAVCFTEAGYTCSGTPSVCVSSASITVSYLVDGVASATAEPGDAVVSSWVSGGAPAGATVTARFLDAAGTVRLEDSELSTTGSVTYTIPATYDACVAYLGGVETLTVYFEAVLMNAAGGVAAADRSDTLTLWCT